jgi:hypothetical protein
MWIEWKGASRIEIAFNKRGLSGFVSDNFGSY